MANFARPATTQDVTLPRLALGTWLMGGAKIANPKNDDSKDTAIIRLALDQGIELIDTAQNYANGKCEQLVGQAVKGRSRQNFKVLTKQSKLALGYDQVIKGCYDSLERLGLNYIDYFVCHAVDPTADMRQFFKASNQLHKEGLIKHVGVSNFGPKMLALATDVSDSPISLNQVSFSLNDNSIMTSGTYDFCRQAGIPIQAYRSLLTLADNDATLDVLAPIALAHGLTIHQAALAYLASYQVSFTLRASSAEHWVEVKKAIDTELTTSELVLIRELQDSLPPPTQTLSE